MEQMKSDLYFTSYPKTMPGKQQYIIYLSRWTFMRVKKDVISHYARTAGMKQGRLVHTGTYCHPSYGPQHKQQKCKVLGYITGQNIDLQVGKKTNTNIHQRKHVYIQL
jgi:hypothetical protein